MGDGRGHAETGGGRGFGALLGTTFLIYALNNVETTAMPGYVVELGGSPLLAAAQTSLFVLAAVALRLFFGPLSDRVGPRAVMAAGALGFALPCAALPFCSTLWQVVALRMCQAVGLAAFHPCVSLCVARLSEPGILGRRTGVVRFTATLSLMVGPVALFPLIESTGYRAFFLVLCACGLAGLALLAPIDDGGRRERGKDNTAGKPATGTTWIDCRTGALLAFPLVAALGYGAVLNFGKLLVQGTLPGVNDGLIFTFASIGGLVGSLAAGRAVDRMGERGVVGACLACVAAGTGLLAGTGSVEMLGVGGVLFGLGYFGATTAMTAALARRVPAHRKGRALAIQQSCLDVGLAAGGLLAGGVVQALGSVPAALACTAVLVAACVPVWLALAAPAKTKA